MNPFSLFGQTALVTGANSGIGHAIGVAMGRAGTHVVCAARSNCDETVGMIESSESLSLDFADPMAERGVFTDRQVDILVNNADDIDETAVFLSPPAANYIHGAVSNVDGGWLAR